MPKFYITNAIPYVNAKPHIGHALEFVQSDVVARYHRLIGDETLLLCGGDENALKNVQAAEQAGRPVQEFVDHNNQLFVALAQALKVQFDVWQKGSSKQHFASSQELWQRCVANGDIYKKNYTGLYCVGCELFYESEELNADGDCYEHPGKKLEKVSEENYFFKLSNYQAQLEELLITDKLQIIPSYRKNEMLTFLKQGLRDISISRSNLRAKNWGVPVPDDKTQRMYVWFDALNIYQSGIGFGSDQAEYRKWWPADLQMIGKGILRFHALYWPAFLLSAKLELPKLIFVHGYLTINGQKMSKTLGNVVDPQEIIKKYGADALRYYLLKEVSATGDGDFSEEKLKEVYNADLANGLGNLVARVAKLCEKADCEFPIFDHPQLKGSEEFSIFIKRFAFSLAFEEIWQEIKAADVQINNDQPWLNSGENLIAELKDYVRRINYIAFMLQPFLPETAQKILDQFKGPKVVAQPPLFPRI